MKLSEENGFKMQGFLRKSYKILLAILLTCALLVSTHNGEFWPFSIYPMFSQAGKPWTRALLRDVTATPHHLLWQTTDFNHLQGIPVALNKTGTTMSDFSSFVSETTVWNHKKKQALIALLGKKSLGHSRWMIMKVHGWLGQHDSVEVQVIPFLLITKDSVFTNPSFSTETYTSDH